MLLDQVWDNGVHGLGHLLLPCPKGFALGIAMADEAGMTHSPLLFERERVASLSRRRSKVEPAMLENIPGGIKFRYRRISSLRESIHVANGPVPNQGIG